MFQIPEICKVRLFKNGCKKYQISFGKAKYKFKIYQWRSFQQVQITSAAEDHMQYETAYKSGQLFSEKRKNETYHRAVPE